jgi:protein-disulfide isomerase
MSTRKRVSRQKRKNTPRKNGLVIIGIVVLLAVVAVAGLVMANQRPPASVGDFTPIETREWPMAEGKALGPADAPVVLREYSDFQCPYCRQFSAGVFNQILTEYVETGKARFEYHHFIVIDGNAGGNESRMAAQASECASEQGRFWDYNKILFTNQQGEGTGAFSDDRLKAFAASLGLDTGKFNACLKSNRAATSVTADEAQARALKVTGTPALFVNDKKVDNPLDYAAVKAAIDEALSSVDQ